MNNQYCPHCGAHTDTGFNCPNSCKPSEGLPPTNCLPDFDDDHRLCCDLEHGDEQWRVLRDYTGRPVRKPQYWHHMTRHLRQCGWVRRKANATDQTAP